MRAITQMLSDSEKEVIHETSLKVLEKTGVDMGSEKVAAMLKQKGANVIGTHVRFPKEMVREYLPLVNKKITMAARNDAHSFTIPATEFPYVTTAGYMSLVTDEGASKPRPAVNEDLKKFSILCDAIDEFGFYWPIVLPTDCPDSFMEYIALETAYTYNSKHIQASCCTGAMAIWEVELAALLAGGKEALRKAPTLSLLAATFSPLALEGGAAEANVYAAEHGIPVAPMSLPLMGSTSPVSFAGNTVLTNVEELMCYMLVKCANPDAPFIYCADSGAPNMTTLAYNYNNPQYLLTAAANADMARFYGMPSMVASGTGELKDFSSRCGFERNIYKAAMAYMTRSDLSCSFGSLDNCLSSSFAEVILDTEAYRYAKEFLRSYEITEEKLAAKVIDEVGPHGNYLNCEHTFRYFKEEVGNYNPEQSFIFNATAGKDHRALAMEKAEAIWSSHEVPAIDKDLLKEMTVLKKKALKSIVGE